MSRTAKALKKWNRKASKRSRLLYNVATELIFHLDLAQEERMLTEEERLLRDLLKKKLLGFAAIERIRIRQWSRLTWIKVGDANSKLFQLRANGRRRKNHIPYLQGPEGFVFEKQQKAQILWEHFNNLMGTARQRNFSLNWEYLQLPSFNLEHLDAIFTMEELKKAVLEMHDEKSPGPDGFIGGFFKKCWELIKGDLLEAINQFFSSQRENMESFE